MKRNNKDKLKLLGKKRIRLSNKSIKVKNKNINNLTFDNLLRLKKTFEPEKNKTMEDFKLEYDELYSEIEENKKLYVILQQSIIYLKTNNKQSFYETTYEALRKILLQEIKIINYKTRLFYRLMLNSQNSNYTKDKTIQNNIFKDVNEEYNINKIIVDEEIRKNNKRKSTENNLNDNFDNQETFDIFLGSYENIKENLFMTKSNNLNSIFIYFFIFGIY